MAFYDFIKNKFGSLIKTDENKVRKRKEVLTVQQMIEELGMAREAFIGSYDTEENPDSLGPADYIQMQENDGEVQAIVRILTLPIISTELRVLPHENDTGEKDFIETVLMKPSHQGGMTTPLPFLVADMTRAIFEGFRLYEKVARVIEEGPWAGKIGWKKLAPRDARTVDLRADEHGGFKGAYQRATFGGRSKNVAIPPEKCLLFTFQKEKHWLYGQSILKSAYYHYDKKHKLYYIAHKKAEIEALGLKVMKINQNISQAQRDKAEEVVDTIGINSRVTLPPGVELEIERGGKGYDPLPLIEHHNGQMAKSALTQVLNQVKYAYPYGSKTTSSDFLILTIRSIMKQMEETLNTYAVAPLIDYNFDTRAYPKIKFGQVTDETQNLLKEVFTTIVSNPDSGLPDGFIDEIINRTARTLKLDWAYSDNEKDSELKKKALKAFEKGKLQAANKKRIPAPKTPSKIRERILRISPQEDLIEKCSQLGEEYIKLLYKDGETEDVSEVRDEE